MKSAKCKKRILLITTYATALDNFNRGIFEALRKQGWQVVGCTSPDPQFSNDNIRQRGFSVVTMPFVRQPSVFRDMWCFVRLWWYLLWHRYDVIHCSTPKAMLLGTIASLLTAHRKVFITVRGRAYENTTGFKRRFFIWLDRMTCALAGRVIVVSPSLREVMLQDKIGTPDKLVVFGQGSSKGVNLDYFSKEQVTKEDVLKFRQSLALNEDDKIILFVGRVREDKGVNELVQAFLVLSTEKPQWHMVLLGDKEPVGTISPEVKKALEQHPKIHCLGHIQDTRVAYVDSEFLVLPTWREGFPNVILEAAAIQLPVITTDAVGAIDSVIHEKTGLIVPMKDQVALGNAMQRLMNTPELCTTLSDAAFRRVTEKFDQNMIVPKIVDFLTNVE